MYGGGIFLDGDEYFINELTMYDNSEIHDNKASIDGGGVYINAGHTTISGYTKIYGNIAQRGGGIFIGQLVNNFGVVYPSILMITGGTIYGNQENVVPEYPKNIATIQGVSLFAIGYYPYVTIISQVYIPMEVEDYFRFSNNTIIGFPSE